MGFSALLGNHRLKDNLTAAVNSGKNAHFYLICGAPGSGRHTLARLLAAALQCQGEKKPCLTCNACRKALADTHPDIITVDDPEKVYVPIDVIRAACADLYVRPNEGQKKIYLIPRANKLRPEAQNAFLKSLEEPPPYGVFLLICDNPESMLPTIRSRSVELVLQPLDQRTLTGALKARFPQAGEADLEAAYALSGGYLGQALTILQDGGELFPETEQFLRAYAHKDELGLVRLLAPMEKYKRDRLIPILEQWTVLVQQALTAHFGGNAPLQAARQLGKARAPGDLQRAIRELKKVTDYAYGNVSTAAICGYLSWHLQ